MGKSLGIFFLIISFPMIVLSEPVKWPKTIAAFGDSMTEGLLASYALEKGLPTAEYIRMLQIAQMQAELRLPAFRKAYANRELSWATGYRKEDLIRSHFERIAAHEPEAKAWNFAVSGAHSKDLSDQIKEMESIVKEIPGGFDYIMLLIGNNDLMGKTLSEMGSAEALEMNLDLAVDEILRLNPRAKLLVSGPPKIFEIFDASKDLQVMKVMKYSITCGNLRKKIYGDEVIFKPEEIENYQAAQDLLFSYWKVIRELPERVSWLYPEAEIKVIEIPNSEQRAEKLLSVDCFHPSEWGQAELAANTWRLGFWGQF